MQFLHTEFHDKDSLLNRSVSFVNFTDFSILPKEKYKVQISSTPQFSKKLSTLQNWA